MKVLMINKFLFPKGGAETYTLELATQLEKEGHEVEYFGMEHENRTVGNRCNSYTSSLDFHTKNKFTQLSYPFKIIYSKEARSKIRKVLDDFCPDVCHLNNFNFQLTPSIILEIVKWRKQNKRNCKIIATAHDVQLVCPNHQMRNPFTNQNCEKCLTGNFLHCIKGKCIHKSLSKSFIGALEAYFWKFNGAYQFIDTIICCSHFLKTKLDSNILFKEKTIALHNFINSEKLNENNEIAQNLPEKYVLFFGRYSQEKGIKTLVEVCKKLPDIQFVFAGSGPLESSIKNISNIINIGFQQKEVLVPVIKKSSFTLCPSEVYENCPFSVLESLSLGVPVIGARIGGIPELIKEGETGELFESRNANELACSIQKLWDNEALVQTYKTNAQQSKFLTIQEYTKKIIDIYT